MRMRDMQPGLVDRLAAEDENVDVDRARPPALAPLAAKLPLNGKHGVEQAARRQRRFDAGGRVQEGRLVRLAPGRRLVEGGHRLDAYRGVARQEVDGSGQDIPAVADVAA
jgi:hypothetical protein